MEMTMKNRKCTRCDGPVTADELLIVKGLLANEIREDIMYGIYRITRVRDDLADDLRTAQRKNAEFLRDVDKLRNQVVDLKLALDREKNRKIHDADND